MDILLSTQAAKKISRLKSYGRSMVPFLYDQDVVFLKKTKFSQIKINDIVTVKKRGKKIFTHRVIYITPSYLITKGDNNYLSDGKRYPKQIVGKISKIKRGRRILNLEELYLIQSTLYFQEIVKIKKAFQENKTNLVFLKGLPLHLYFEKSHPRRIYLDCDVLMEKTDFHKAKKILKEFGYDEVDFPLSRAHKSLKKKPAEVSFGRILNGFPVVFDIHLEAVFMMTQIKKLEVLYPKDLVDKLTKDFLKEKRVIKIQKETFPILNINNLILYLSLHLFHHNFRGIFRLDFLDKVIRTGLSNRKAKKTHRADYKALVEKIKRYGFEGFVYPSLILTKKYFKTPIPTDFLKKIRPSKYKLLYIKKKVLTANVFNSQTRIEAGANRFMYLFFLSPKPIYKKIFVFLEAQIIYSVFWVIYRKLLKHLKSLNKK